MDGDVSKDFSYEFQDELMHFYKDTFWNFDRYYIKYIDEFTENCHLNNTESSNL